MQDKGRGPAPLPTPTPAGHRSLRDLQLAAGQDLGHRSTPPKLFPQLLSGDSQAPPVGDGHLLRMDLRNVWVHSAGREGKDPAKIAGPARGTRSHSSGLLVTSKGFFLFVFLVAEWGPGMEGGLFCLALLLACRRQQQHGYRWAGQVLPASFPKLLLRLNSKGLTGLPPVQLSIKLTRRHYRWPGGTTLVCVCATHVHTTSIQDRGNDVGPTCSMTRHGDTPGKLTF